VTSPRDDEFTSFVSARSGPLLRLAVGLAADRAAGEDLLQAALTKAYLSWTKARAADNPEAYVRRIIVTTHLSLLRRRRIREVGPALLDQAAPVPPAYGVDDRDALWAALRRLGRQQRAVVVLRYYEDLPDDQIAVLLGCRPATVRSQAMRALATLRGLPELAEHQPSAPAEPSWEAP
jgi:RNA polymerase sigma-70 factor (sigma-E family)